MGLLTQQKKEKCLLWKVACETSMQPGEKQRNQSDETKKTGNKTERKKRKQQLQEETSEEPKETVVVGTVAT